jgi:3-phosphoshikimate 1-carboxyvinyltransferase
LHFAKASLDGQDSQPVSALLMLGTFHPLELKVQNPGEKPWIDLTLSWLKRLNVPYVNDNYRSYKVSGGKGIDAFEYKVPGDFSSASFFKLATLITDSQIELENLDTNDVQGDKAVLDVLDAMSSEGPMRIDVNPFIDALPVLAVAACFRKGATTLFNGAIARKKESDRIAAMAQELRKMGAILEEREDGLYIEPSSLKGAKLHSHSDHRIAMALSIAALGATGPSEISEVECTAKSYPNFFQELKKLGGKIG